MVPFELPSVRTTTSLPYEKPSIPAWQQPRKGHRTTCSLACKDAVHP